MFEFVNQGISFIGSLPILLFLMAVGVSSTFADSKKLLWVILAFAATLAVSLFVNVYGFYSISKTLSWQFSAALLLVVGVVNLRKKVVANRHRALVLFTVFITAFHGLNAALARQVHNKSHDFFETFLGRISFSTIAFSVGVFAFIAIFSLIVTAFSAAKRELVLVVSGGVIGVSLLLFISSFSL